MTDLIDQAQAREEADRDKAIAGARAPQRVAEGPCIDCGGEVPDARRAAVPWATRCVDCQQDFDRAAAGQRHRAFLPIAVRLIDFEGGDEDA